MPESALARKTAFPKRIGTGNDQGINMESKFPDAGLVAVCRHRPPGPKDWSHEE
jgi:hypothetical protein